MGERRYEFLDKELDMRWWTGTSVGKAGNIWCQRPECSAFMPEVVEVSYAAHLASVADALRAERDEALKTGKRFELVKKLYRRLADHWCSDCRDKLFGQRCYRCQWQEAQAEIARLKAEVESWQYAARAGRS